MKNIVQNIRHDSVDNIFFGEQLLSRHAEALETLYPESKAFDVVPMETDHNPGARSVAYAIKDVQGEAGIVANKARRPMMEMNAQEFLRYVRNLEIGYCYTSDDIAASQMAGVPLSGDVVTEATRLVLRGFDRLTAYGDSANGIASGFTNDPNVVSAPAAAAWGLPGTTGDAIVAEFSELLTDLRTSSLGIHTPDTFAVPEEVITALMVKRLSASDLSALDWIEARGRVQVIPWHRLADSAGDGSDVSKGVLYSRRKDLVHCDLVQDAQPLSLVETSPGVFEGAVKLRTAGCVFTHPLSARALTGI